MTQGRGTTPGSVAAAVVVADAVRYPVARPGNAEEETETAVEDATATAGAVEMEGAAAEVSVETEGGSEEGKVPEDFVCPRADDDSATAAITLMRRLFTGRDILPKSERVGAVPSVK